MTKIAHQIGTYALRSVALIAAAALCPACSQTHQADKSPIEATMKKTWDRPDAPLVVGPIAVAGDAALADWTQTTMGGRALLKRVNSEWRVVLCAGDSIKQVSALRLAGIPQEQARQIVIELTAQERDVEPARLAAIASFRGEVRMDHADAHPTRAAQDTRSYPARSP